MLEQIMTSIKEVLGLRTRRSDVVDFVDQRSRARREEAHDAISELLTELTTTTKRERKNNGDGGEKDNQ